MLRDIRCLRTETHRRERRPPRHIQIQLQRLRQAPHRKRTRGARRQRRIDAVGDLCGYGGVVLSDEVPPDGLEGGVEGGGLVRGGGSEVGAYVGAVLRAGDGVLVFVGGMLGGGEG